MACSYGGFTIYYSEIAFRTKKILIYSILNPLMDKSTTLNELYFQSTVTLLLHISVQRFSGSVVLGLFAWVLPT
jgi:hypothetical protein